MDNVEFGKDKLRVRNVRLKLLTGPFSPVTYSQADTANRTLHTRSVTVPADRYRITFRKVVRIAIKIAKHLR
jgi:hypothetical protein